MTKDEAIQKLLNQRDLTKTYLNWFEEGGAEIVRVNYDWWVLFEIPQYGGEPQYFNTYHKSELDKLVTEAFSWT
jgi:hypothetical protein